MVIDVPTPLNNINDVDPSASNQDNNGSNFNSIDQNIIQQYLFDAIQLWDENNNNNNNSSNKKKKTMTPAIIKVHQMKIKSKAIGDIKRIPNIVDRFYFELILIIDDNTTSSSTCIVKTSNYYYLSMKDRIDRIIRDCCSTISTIPNGKITSWSWELYIIPLHDVIATAASNSTHQQLSNNNNTVTTQSQPQYYKICCDLSMSIGDGIKQNRIQQFNRMIVRYFPNIIIE